MGFSKLNLCPMLFFTSPAVQSGIACLHRRRWNWNITISLSHNLVPSRVGMCSPVWYFFMTKHSAIFSCWRLFNINVFLCLAEDVTPVNTSPSEIGVKTWYFLVPGSLLAHWYIDVYGFPVRCCSLLWMPRWVLRGQAFLVPIHRASMVKRVL